MEWVNSQNCDSQMSVDIRKPTHWALRTDTIHLLDSYEVCESLTENLSPFQNKFVTTFRNADTTVKLNEIGNGQRPWELNLGHTQ